MPLPLLALLPAAKAGMTTAQSGVNLVYKKRSLIVKLVLLILLLIVVYLAFKKIRSAVSGYKKPSTAKKLSKFLLPTPFLIKGVFR